MSVVPPVSPERSRRGWGDRWDDLPVAAPEPGPKEPLFDVAASTVDRFMDTPPPPREWIVESTVPKAIVGLLAGMGGVGKSFFGTQLGVCVASGTEFMGIPISSPGGFLHLAAEDDEAELHRRLWAVIEHYILTARDAGRHFDRGALRERLHVVSRVAQDNMLTVSTRNEGVLFTELVERLCLAATQIPDLRMILVDPVSRFRGGQANQEEDSTRFVEALELVRAETGAAVIAFHHISQAGIKDGGGQEIVRGSTALVDGVRWVGTLQRLPRNKAPEYGVQESDVERYIRFEIPKSNYTRPFPGLWLRREFGGVLVPVDLDRTTTGRRSKAQQEATEDYLDILARLQHCLKERGPMTTNRIESDLSGRLGPLGVGQKTIRAIVQRALQSGDLVDAGPNGTGGRLIDVPGDDHA